MERLVVSSVLTAMLAAGTAFAIGDRLKAGEESSFAVPRMATPPKIDGTIAPAEWREAVAVSGVTDVGNDLLDSRPATFYLAWDAKHLYMACRVYLRGGGVRPAGELVQRPLHRGPGAARRRRPHGRRGWAFRYPHILDALQQLAGRKSAEVLAVSGKPYLRVLKVGKGMLVLDRRSPDASGNSNLHLAAWQQAWRQEIEACGLAPNGTGATLLPVGSETLRQWFFAE